MRLLVAVVLAMTLAGSATAQTGLSGAIDHQRQNMATQQADTRREIERQQGSLQQQQDQNLQFQLLLRQQPVPPPTIRPCAPITGAIVCQ
jgi:hypothetical protein